MTPHAWAAQRNLALYDLVTYEFTADPGFGGMMSFMLKENTLEAVSRFIPRLRFAHAAANLGAVETIVGPPATTSHVECTQEERARHPARARGCG